jgi:beta-lactamase class A
MLRRFFVRSLREPKGAIMLLGLCFLMGGILGYLLHPERVPTDATWGPIRTPLGEYRMIQPLLACDFPFDESNEKLKALKSKLQSEIKDAQKRNAASDVSVYIRTMNSGGVMGINENTLYDPASMIKVVLMMTYARVAEDHPDLFTKQLTMTNNILHEGDGERYYGSTSLTTGKKYSIGELIDTMIVNSDNGAKDLLLVNIPAEEIIHTLKDYNMKLSREGGDDPKMSPKDISMFFRTLYSATYLDPLHSEVALELLSRTTFKDGIVDGVPYGIQIAHKFGEFITSDQSGNIKQFELHDCGIVYAPGNPYFLCIMTRGSSHEALTKLISTISRYAYDTMTSARP